MLPKYKLGIYNVTRAKIENLILDCNIASINHKKYMK